ncbi:energy transducer TonB [Vibrio albus]|uniref:Protein TonB n=1 Tax=Vibrio albus TaxID=2200953 RepID=A0A2U3BC47_9VIBR|nr:energy transducer TonB [Vibrio albus]PWI34358.1 energy transducer TonB [Vibrio albus]
MKRLLLSFPLAVTTTAVLFSLMVWMVGIDAGRSPEQESVARFDLLMAESESEAKQRTRRLPDPPEKPKVAPEEKPTAVSPSSQPLESALPDLPELKMDFAVEGLAVSAPDAPAEVNPMAEQVTDIGQNQQVMPLHRMEPRYPRRALSRKIEGYVVLSFSIDKTGVPTDIEIVESEPRRIFDREARRALKRWKYQPQMVNGSPVKRAGQKVRLEFRIQQ